MKAENCTRYGFEINGQPKRYGDLRHYVCNQCGGNVTHSFVRVDGQQVDRVACPRCGCEEFVTERTYQQQISDGWEVLQGLPDHLRTLLEGGQRQCLSATEAAADLFG